MFVLTEYNTREKTSTCILLTNNIVQLKDFLDTHITTLLDGLNGKSNNMLYGKKLSIDKKSVTIFCIGYEINAGYLWNSKSLYEEDLYIYNITNANIGRTNSLVNFPYIVVYKYEFETKVDKSQLNEEIKKYYIEKYVSKDLN